MLRRKTIAIRRLSTLGLNQNQMLRALENDKDLQENITHEQEHVLEEHSIDARLKALPTSDEIDFRLKENILNCKHCRLIMGDNKTRYFKKDPKMYQFLINYRATMKKDRVRPDDIGDDPQQMDIL